MTAESDGKPHKRRLRYRGTHPRRFEEKYKEHNPALYPETIQKVVASGKTPAGMHRPIMVEEILEVLAPNPGETAVDCTLGYGGHASRLLELLQPGGRLIGLDRDPLELQKTGDRLRAQWNESQLILRRSNFAGLNRVLADLKIDAADLILADLGVSSMQLDDPARGFSFKIEGPLDLRLDPTRGRSAAEILSTIKEDDLARALVEYADEPRGVQVAAALLASRPIETTTDLARAIETVSRSPEEEQTIRRVFQALRILVNDELGSLDNLLRILPSCLKPAGRVAFLTFHSGEDRRVKHHFLQGFRDGIYSRWSEEPLRPTSTERHANPRASSAKLRWAVRAEA
jgi:16S rRNA (cytosine1402-N4)-methyltransferase